MVGAVEGAGAGFGGVMESFLNNLLKTSGYVVQSTIPVELWIAGELLRALSLDS